MEQLSQGLSQLFHAVEETQRSIMSFTMATLKSGGDKVPSGSAGVSSPKAGPPKDHYPHRRELGKSVINSDEVNPKTQEVTKMFSEKEGMIEARFGRKLDMPIFNGETPEGWVFQAERYFHLNQLMEEEKQLAGVVCLDGDALTWFGWRETRKEFASWTELKVQIL